MKTFTKMLRLLGTVMGFLLLLNTVELHAQIDNFPYEEDFEDDNGGWTIHGTNSTWEWGAPNATMINSAASGSKAWVTNLTGNYANDEFSWIESPEFDFQYNINPVVTFKIWWDTQYTIDGQFFKAQKTVDTPGMILEIGMTLIGTTTNTLQKFPVGMDLQGMIRGGF